jgi:hypothetical protein
MTHMTRAHSFFIPDVEYLKDLRGLIKYLGEKITIGYTCLWCNGKGRGFHSAEGVRGHMVRCLSTTTFFLAFACLVSPIDLIFFFFILPFVYCDYFQ